MQIDLEPRRHSSSYELKPMSRWWLLPPSAGVALAALANGAGNPVTWALAVFGALLMAAFVVVFPRYFLTRRD
jgi:hypothetical protein